MRHTHTYVTNTQHEYIRTNTAEKLRKSQCGRSNLLIQIICNRHLIRLQLLFVCICVCEIIIDCIVCVRVMLYITIQTALCILQAIFSSSIVIFQQQSKTAPYDYFAQSLMILLLFFFSSDCCTYSDLRQHNRSCYQLCTVLPFPCHNETLGRSSR